MLLYGKHGAQTFQERVGHTFGYREATLTTLILLGLMYVLALAWSRIKRGPSRLKLAVELGTLAVFVGIFFFRAG
jgi:hypothetical protein